MRFLARVRFSEGIHHRRHFGPDPAETLQVFHRRLGPARFGSRIDGMVNSSPEHGRRRTCYGTFRPDPRQHVDFFPEGNQPPYDEMHVRK